MPDITDLQIERFYDFKFIPCYLIDQMQDKNYSADRLYQLGPLLVRNPLNYLYVLTDQDHVIKGVLFCSVEGLSQQMHINIFSVDPEYQVQGTDNKTRDFIVRFVKDLIKELNESELYQKIGLKLLDTISAITTHPKAWEQTGWKRSKQIIMKHERINHE